MSESNKEPNLFCCPGETKPISRAMHLARLATFSSRCRECPHRNDTTGISPKTAKRLAEVHAEASCSATFDDEGLSGVLVNELTPDVARRAATAFGLWLREREGTAYTGSDWPTVLLSSDGRLLSAPLVAAAAQGLRFAGCHVSDIGQATTGCLTFAIDRSGAQGGLAIGSMGHRTHEAALRFWRKSKPLSRGAGLEQIRTILEGHLDRPTRQFGTLRRVSFEKDYLDSLAEYYHGLRPLRVVLDTPCGPMVEYLHHLCQSLECRLFDEQSSETTAQDRTIRHKAHLAAVIDGGGEMCRVLDERGEPVANEQLLQLVARHLLQCVEAQPEPTKSVSPTIVVEEETMSATVATLGKLGYRVTRAGHQRAEMHRAMQQEKALFGGGPSGRFWHALSGRATPDALVTLSLLLVILSQSDRPLSRVLDETTPAG